MHFREFWIILHDLVMLPNVGKHELLSQYAMLPGHEGSFKDHKYPFWMTQKTKKEVFGPFIEFGLLNRLDIAYCDSTKCFPTFGNVTSSWRIIQKAQ